MTYEEALQIAMEELYDAVEDLRYNNKGYHAHIEAQCNRLLTARNVLCKELEEKREWMGLTEVEFKELIAGVWFHKSRHEDVSDLRWFSKIIEAKLKEKNT